MKHILNLILVFFLFSYSAASQASSLSLEVMTAAPDEWEEFCSSKKQLFQKGYYNNKLLSYFDPELYKGEFETALDSAGIKIPVKSGSHEFTADIGTSYTSYSMRNDDFVLTIDISEEEYFDNLWPSNTSHMDSKGKILTEEIYEEPVSSLQLLIDSLRYTSDDMHCEEQTRFSDANVILSIERRQMNASHPSIIGPWTFISKDRSLESLIEVRSSDKRNVFNAVLVGRDNNKVVISLYVKKDADYDVRAFTKSFVKMNELIGEPKR